MSSMSSVTVAAVLHSSRNRPRSSHHRADDLAQRRSILPTRYRRLRPQILSALGRPNARSSLQHRHDLFLPKAGKRVGRRRPRAALRWVGNRGSASIRYAGSGKAGLRRSDGRTMALTGLHVQPRLAVGDVSARQALIPPEEESDAALTAPAVRQAFPLSREKASP